VTTSLLAPTYALTLGTQLWTEQALGLTLRLDPAPLLNVLEVSFPAAAPLDAALADPVELKLDGGEGESLVFTGEIDSIRRGVEETTVRALDAGGKLAAYRPAATFEQVTVGTLVKTLCAEVGATPGDVETGPTLAFYAADPSRTALEHVARLASWAGALARVTADNELDASIVRAGEPELALLFGRELIAVDGTQSSAPVTSFVVAGEGGAGSPSAPDALRPTTDFFAGNRPDGPSAEAVWRFEPALRTADAAQTASAARTRSYTSARTCGTFEAFLLPSLRPGTVLEIQELPEGLGTGPFWLDRVAHELSPEGARTTARLRQGGETFDPLALLGSLAGAIGL
jgi:hypothetical protein